MYHHIDWLLHDIKNHHKHKEVHSKLYTIREIHKLEGEEKKPILFDNAVFHELLRESLLKIGTQEEIIAHQKHVLNTVREVLVVGNKMNPHTGDKIRIITPPKRTYNEVERKIIS